MLQTPEQRTNLARRYLPLGATYALALVVLGGTILYAAYDLRAKSRQQITSQHARILYALWLSQKFNETEGVPPTPEKAADQVSALLKTAWMQLPQLAGLFGTRLFEVDGRSKYTDPNVCEGPFDPDDLVELRELNPVAHFLPSADLGKVLMPLPQNSPAKAPLLVVTIPLHTPGRKQLVGVGQFLLDGTHVAAEFRTLDRNLIRQALITFLVGGALLGVVLGLGFRQLQRLNRLLTERTQSLLRANQELAVAAKTSAVGAVTAHLIHGLKNPLSGLQAFVASRSAAAADPADRDWELAVSSTRRMQTMISEIVRVLQDEDVESQYEITLEEFAQMLEAKVAPLAREAGVLYQTRLGAQGTLRNRDANLISLVLYNLVQNAIQATAKGKQVSLSFAPAGDKIAAEVTDEGPGLSEEQQATLFKPCRSRKEGGSGIGLAISKQLANYIGAQLELKQSNARGTVFVLVFGVGSSRGNDRLVAESARP